MSTTTPTRQLLPTTLNHLSQPRRRSGRFTAQFSRLKISREVVETVTVFPRRVSITQADKLAQVLSFQVAPERIGLRAEVCENFPQHCKLVATGATPAELRLLKFLCDELSTPGAFESRCW